MPSSSFLGTPTERWPLSRAVDALADSARRAGIPGLIWIAGASYPGLNLNVELVRALLGLAEDYSGVDLPGAGGTGQIVTLFAPQFIAGWMEDTRFWATILTLLIFLPVLLVLSRMVVGLAKISDLRLWESSEGEAPYVLEHGLVEAEDIGRRRTPRLGSAWRAGKGLGLVALGLWGMLALMLLGAGLILIGPVVILVRTAQLEAASPVFAGILVPPLLLLLAYAAVLMVINQLSMHSLAHNRRGVSSALTHAWRLIRAAPMSVLRAAVVDFVLAASIVVLVNLTSRVVGALDTTLASVVIFLLYGFAGVTRAGFWARAYRALGGLSSADHVPGL